MPSIDESQPRVALSQAAMASGHEEVVDLVSPSVAPPCGQVSRRSFGSCISETPSPQAGGSKGEEEKGREGKGRRQKTSESRAVERACPITGLPVDAKLAAKLQSSSQVTVATLRRALHNVMGLPYEDIQSKWCRDALILEYHSALKDWAACSLESGRCSSEGTTRPAESRRSPEPLASGSECIQSADSDDGSDDCFRAAKVELAGSCLGKSIGMSKQAGGSFSRRRERKRERQDADGEELEGADRDLPLWQRLEMRRTRKLQQDSSGRAANASDDSDTDVFAAPASWTTVRATGSVKKTVKLAPVTRVPSAGPDSDESISDLTCPGHREASTIAPAGRAWAGHVERQMEEDVARLMRERDAEVRQQAAAAVEALDFERAALVKRKVHADFEKKISAAKRRWQGKTPGRSRDVEGGTVDVRPAVGKASGQKRSEHGDGASAAVSKHAGRLTSEDEDSRKRMGEGAHSGQEEDGMPAYSAMSIGELKKIMSR